MLREARGVLGGCLYSVVFSLAAPAFCKSVVDLVIANGDFGHYLSDDSANFKVPDGRLINVSFRHTNDDFRPPYLIADRFCSGGCFMRGGTAHHLSAEPIDLVCVKGGRRKDPQAGGIGN